MSIIGFSAGFHDAGMAVVNYNGDILFAGHSERYSKLKHDSDLCPDIVSEALRAANEVDTIAYYEKPFAKWTRQLMARQNPGLPRTTRSIVKKQFGEYYPSIKNATVKSYGHHLAHAAAGFQTSPFNDAVIVVIDAIGEWDTISIWEANYTDKGVAQYKKLYTQKYPHSIGLMYSAFTEKVGLRPMDEEYILMGMAAYGSDKNAGAIHNAVLNDVNHLTFNDNLHAGIDLPILDTMSDYDIAACAQTIVEELIFTVINKARQLSKNKNLVYCGGVALNCSANRLLGLHYKNIWIMPNPGDAGSALGAAALAYGKKLNWTTAFLGARIGGKYPVQQLIKELLTSRIVGVASGKAEFGPRSLGNRSLLADPRGNDIKDLVNTIKKRQKFRPFAPVILEEHVSQYFNMPANWHTSPYMQVTARCIDPTLFPAIVHKDGTSRVQTVPNDGSGIRLLLEEWYKQTGCPMLLNTSLNVRGEPMVNDVEDAHRFTQLYGVPVYS